MVLSFASVDLVESTETLARLAERRTDSVVAYLKIVRAAVATHGGWEVARDGDRIVAGFLAPTDAVACAVAVQRACGWHNRGAADRLDVRIGVQLGEAGGAWASRSSGTSLPDPAVEAGRLAQAAAGGQVLVSALVASLAHPRSVRFERSGLLDIGTVDPMSTFEARPTAEPVPSVELPAHLIDDGRRTPFVGRPTERDRLKADWKSAAAGHRLLAVVTGEPGAGKTRLAQEFVRAIHAEGGLVLWGRSFEEAVLPYQPFAEMLSQYFTGAEPQELGWLSGTVRRQLARLAPEACPRGGTGAEHGTEVVDRHRLFEAVGAFMVGASFGAPVLLVLDDLQWADPTSLLLLKSLVLDRRAAALMVLGIYRDTDVQPSHPLARVLADIERERRIDHILLGGLEVSDVAEMMGTLTPVSAPELSRDVWEETAGNPFFAEELISHVKALAMVVGQPAEGGRPADTRLRPQLSEVEVPRRVKDRLGRRLQRLSAPTRDALATAAVIGPRFGIDALERVLLIGQPRLVPLMDEAVRARLISEVPDTAGRYRFRHPIVQRALCGDHTAAGRALIRARAAKVLDTQRAGQHARTSRQLRRRPHGVAPPSAVVRPSSSPLIGPHPALGSGEPPAPEPRVVTAR